jgi:aspartyl protease family protein
MLQPAHGRLVAFNIRSIIWRSLFIKIGFRMANYRNSQKTWLIVIILAVASLFALASATQPDTLRTQLENLAKEHRFHIDGLEQLGSEPSKQTEGDIRRQINSLLADYNFMIVGGGVKIERVSISSLKNVAPKPKSSGAVKTRRMGAHHQVRALLYGPNDVEISTNLMVDTGASTLVLPESMIQSLGFSLENLRNSVSQTAAGQVPVKTGVLKSVRIGDISAENVTVSFINDQKLNGTRLLGMSFLNRFRFSLDDENNELQLMSK